MKKNCKIFVEACLLLKDKMLYGRIQDSNWNDLLQMKTSAVFLSFRFSSFMCKIIWILNVLPSKFLISSKNYKKKKSTFHPAQQKLVQTNRKSFTALSASVLQKPINSKKNSSERKLFDFELPTFICFPLSILFFTLWVPLRAFQLFYSTRRKTRFSRALFSWNPRSELILKTFLIFLKKKTLHPKTILNSPISSRWISHKNKFRVVSEVFSPESR